MNRLFPWGMDLGNINNRILYVPILGHETYRHIVPVCFYRIGDSSYSIKRSARFFVLLWEDKTVEVEVWNF